MHSHFCLFFACYDINHSPTNSGNKCMFNSQSNPLLLLLHFFLIYVANFMIIIQLRSTKFFRNNTPQLATDPCPLSYHPISFSSKLMKWVRGILEVCIYVIHDSWITLYCEEHERRIKIRPLFLLHRSSMFFMDWKCLLDPRNWERYNQLMINGKREDL